MLINLIIVIRWYLKYRESQITESGKEAPPVSGERAAATGKKETAGSKKKVPVLTVTILTVVLLVAIGAILYFATGGRASAGSIEKSVAVLPFRNDSPDDENTYFINGVMEEILNNLQKIKDIRVISRSSVEQYRNQAKSIPEIAKELGVNYIVEGGGQKYGDSFRLRVQLIKAKHETHLYGESFQLNLTGERIFSVSR